MSKRFTAAELLALRQEIDLRQLASEVLRLPIRQEQRGVSIPCPRCGRSAAVLLGMTNLARCETCARNLNAIDLVMSRFGCSFIESVYLLKGWRSRHPQAQQAATISGALRPERRVFRAGQQR